MHDNQSNLIMFTPPSSHRRVSSDSQHYFRAHLALSVRSWFHARLYLPRYAHPDPPPLLQLPGSFGKILAITPAITCESIWTRILYAFNSHGPGGVVGQILVISHGPQGFIQLIEMIRLGNTTVRPW